MGFFLFFLADGVCDRVEGERPRWRPEGPAPQHGLQPERPLPPALLCHPEGTGIQGETRIKSEPLLQLSGLYLGTWSWLLSAFAVSWAAVWGGDGAVCRPVSEAVEELQQQHQHHQSPRQCLALPAYEAKLRDRQRTYHTWSSTWLSLTFCDGFCIFLLVVRTLQEWRCRWPCRFHPWWGRLKILMRSSCVAPWRPSSPTQKKTWSWERPRFQTRYRFMVRLPAARPSRC